MIYTILGVLSFALQNTCCKEYGRKYPQTLYAQSVMVFLSLSLVTLLMALMGGVQALTPRGYFIAAAFGIFFVLTLISMTLAMNCGHMGITLLIQNASLIVPTIFGLTVWNERLTLFKGIGIFLIFVLLALSAGDSSSGDGVRSKSQKRRWVILLTLAFIGDGALSIFQGLMSRECATTDSVTFTFWTSAVSVLVSGGLMLFLRLRGGRGNFTRGNGGALPFAALCSGIGLGTAGGNCFSILALTQLPSIVVFPIRQGALVLLMWLVGIWVYHEKVNRRGLIMLAVGLAGLVLINLG